jgi:hypothetical protein
MTSALNYIEPVLCGGRYSSKRGLGVFISTTFYQAIF